MIKDRIIYTDGHAVKVTDSMFQVNKTEYKLNGITKHGVHIVRPHRLPGILLATMGLALVLIGFLRLTPPSLVDDMVINNTLVSGNTVIMMIGAFLAIVGVVIVGLLRERYAVRIATAEGEKDVVVSSHKEYITQIVDAISSAYKYIRRNSPVW